MCTGRAVHLGCGHCYRRNTIIIFVRRSPLDTVMPESDHLDKLGSQLTLTVSAQASFRP